MTETTPELAQISTRFPVLSGETFLDLDAIPHSLDTATVVMKSAGGIERTIVLQRRRDGQWWASSAVAD